MRSNSSRRQHRTWSKAIAFTITTVVNALGGINHLGHPLEKCSFLLYVGRSKIPKQGTKWGKSAEQHNWAKPDTPQLVTSVITDPDKPHEDEECCTADMDIIVINKELKGVAKSESSSSHGNRGHRAEREGGKRKSWFAPNKNWDSNPAPVLPENFCDVAMDIPIGRDC